MAKDAESYLRATNAVLVDNIRFSDFKANVAIVFVAIMMGPVLGSRDKFPSYFSLAIVLAPFLVVFFCLLICLLPRYPRLGRSNFVIKHNPDVSLFPPPESEGIELERLQVLCAINSRILYWKNLMLIISFYTCIIAVGGVIVLLLYSQISRI
jgi:hypothetical protein